jgi:hypothetical protein
MATIDSLVQGVVAKLANRVDAASNAPFWIKRTIQEMTESYPFIELEETSGVVQFTTGTAIYNKTFFTKGAVKATMFSEISVYIDYPNNSKTNPIFFRELQVVSPMTQIPGLPCFWTQHGDDLIFGLNPQNPYSVYARYQREHSFDAVLGNTIIKMPGSWEELIEYGAAERGAIELRMLDYVTLYHSILFGDPEFELSSGAKGKPGLIFRRLSQHDRNSSNNAKQMPPQQKRYT